tara:strand:+ start:614 stop:1222 length:609 start_codon:yes stop_codon:yes gene_type:complete
MKNFIDDIGITGHLTISKQFRDGEEEMVFDDPNIIVSGMGVGLSYMFNGSGSNSILAYQIDRFQIGVSGPPAGGVVNTITSLSGSLSSVAEYGTGSNLFIEEASQIKGNTIAQNQVFALVPPNKITRINNSSVRYTLVVDEESCNNLNRKGAEMNINEIGLLMQNPSGNNGVNRSLLVAYRTFSNIRKTNDFSLIFRWTLNF